MKTFQRIQHLPDEYQGIVQLIYHFLNEDFNFESVLDELLSEEAKLN